MRLGAPGSAEAVVSSATVDSERAGQAGAVVVHEVDGAYGHDELAPAVLQAGS